MSNHKKNPGCFSDYHWARTVTRFTDMSIFPLQFCQKGLLWIQNKIKKGRMSARRQQFSHLCLVKDVAWVVFEALQRMFSKLCGWMPAGKSCKEDVSLPWRAFFLRTIWNRSYAFWASKLVICEGLADHVSVETPGSPNSSSCFFVGNFETGNVISSRRLHVRMVLTLINSHGRV